MSKQLKMLILAATIGLAATPAPAQTMSFADAVDALATACGKDIDSYCRNVNFGGGRIKTCLERNSAKVSASCKAVAAQTFASLQARSRARSDVIKICDRDAARLCGGVQRGDGQILECMLLARKAVSVSCNQAITDAGYR